MTAGVDLVIIGSNFVIMFKERPSHDALGTYAMQ